MTDLPPHLIPLFQEFDKYPSEVRDDLRAQFLMKVCGEWRDRILTWIKQHPLKDDVVTSEYQVPPIIESGGVVLWIDRVQRRAQR